MFVNPRYGRARIRGLEMLDNYSPTSTTSTTQIRVKRQPHNIVKHTQTIRQPISYTKFFWKANISYPGFAHVRVCIRGLEMLVFRKIWRTY